MLYSLVDQTVATPGVKTQDSMKWSKDSCTVLMSSQSFAVLMLYQEQQLTALQMKHLIQQEE